MVDFRCQRVARRRLGAARVLSSSSRSMLESSVESSESSESSMESSSSRINVGAVPNADKDALVQEVISSSLNCELDSPLKHRSIAFSTLLLTQVLVV